MSHVSPPPPARHAAGPGKHPDVEIRTVAVNGVALRVALAGEGPALLLLHGFPHTWELWRAVIGPLARRHRVIAPDLRWLATGREAPAGEPTGAGYDAATLARDAECLLEALGATRAAVAGIDAGAPPAFLLALRRPDLVRRLVLMESLLGGLPSGGTGDGWPAAGGPRWWFGFHSEPGLAESVLTGHEDRYIGWFLDQGTLGRGVPTALREAFITAYTGEDVLCRAFSYYRALPASARQLQDAAATARLTMPTMAVGAHPIGAALEQQLRPIADDLIGHVLEDCGHIIPLDRPAALLALLQPFLAADITT
ncbi:pimeloyl-ACP methyl ester carboxylesterase [Streptomyces griseochromogenes]|uniref:Pimeloyl-ACP methyl ester carboxylesterase n=1 Tax=Streptomyces griseochromogenes TaxID=68214 RepID=A0ABS4LM47_9ACTN|nr:alpha/beta hydrolase [Streptomyces griseochromogenes]MBP2048364.1 pimeloyl-ACP methyl ester carboxylesterase [Streptomyces griseochromogenes]